MVLIPFNYKRRPGPPRRGTTLARKLAAKPRSKIPFTYKRRPNLARFNASKSQYIVNKTVSKVMNKMSENKLLAITDVNPGAANGTPNNILGSGSDPRVYAWRAVLDTDPNRS